MIPPAKSTLPSPGPSRLVPALELTETLEMTALVGPDKLGANDRMVVLLGVPPPRPPMKPRVLTCKSPENSGGEEESTFNDDDGLIKALATELKGQRWDTDKAAWKQCAPRPRDPVTNGAL